jgi:hypothetical protein
MIPSLGGSTGSGSIRSVRLNHNNDYLLCGGDTGYVSMYQLSTSSNVQSQPSLLFQLPTLSTSRPPPITALALTPGNHHNFAHPFTHHHLISCHVMPCHINMI